MAVYFVWVESCGRAYPQKWHGADGVGTSRCTGKGDKAYYHTPLQRHPLSAADETLSLDALALKYPRPPVHGERQQILTPTMIMDHSFDESAFP